MKMVLDEKKLMEYCYFDESGLMNLFAHQGHDQREMNPGQRTGTNLRTTQNGVHGSTGWAWKSVCVPTSVAVTFS